MNKVEWFVYLGSLMSSLRDNCLWIFGWIFGNNSNGLWRHPLLVFQTNHPSIGRESSLNLVWSPNSGGSKKNLQIFESCLGGERVSPIGFFCATGRRNFLLLFSRKHSNLIIQLMQSAAMKCCIWWFCDNLETNSCSSTKWCHLVATVVFSLSKINEITLVIDSISESVVPPAMFFVVFLT